VEEKRAHCNLLRYHAFSSGNKKVFFRCQGLFLLRERCLLAFLKPYRVRHALFGLVAWSLWAMRCLLITENRPPVKSSPAKASDNMSAVNSHIPSNSLKSLSLHSMYYLPNADLHFRVYLVPTVLCEMVPIIIFPGRANRFSCA